MFQGLRKKEGGSRVNLLPLTRSDRGRLGRGLAVVFADGRKRRPAGDGRREEGRRSAAAAAGAASAGGAAAAAAAGRRSREAVGFVGTFG